MEKGYKNKQLVMGDEVYFFPKENPPISIKATSLKEAEEKLLKLKNKSNE